MRLLLDQDVYARTEHFLRGLNHDVLNAADIGLSQAKDPILLQTAREQRRVFVTRDRDFGRLVYVDEIGVGVIYLRMLPSTVEAVHQQLELVLATYTDDDLQRAFVVVEPGRHRFRRLSPPD